MTETRACAKTPEHMSCFESEGILGLHFEPACLCKELEQYQPVSKEVLCLKMLVTNVRNKHTHLGDVKDPFSKRFLGPVSWGMPEYCLNCRSSAHSCNK